MGQARYFLVTTVTVPVRHDKPLIWGWKPDDSVEDVEEGAEHTFRTGRRKEMVMRQWCMRLK